MSTKKRIIKPENFEMVSKNKKIRLKSLECQQKTNNWASKFWNGLKKQKNMTKKFNVLSKNK